jgi:DNA-binding XRE family transcriptional regulator
MGFIESILTKFGKRVRLFRKKLNYSQAALATLAGLHRSTISEVERGLRDISLATVYKIAGALRVHPYKLVEQPLPNLAVALPFPVLLNARAPGWRHRCVACAGNRENFTVHRAGENDTRFLKVFSVYFGYAALTVGNVINLVPVDRPPVQIVAVPKDFTSGGRSRGI